MFYTQALVLDVTITKVNNNESEFICESEDELMNAAQSMKLPVLLHQFLFETCVIS